MTFYQNDIPYRPFNQHFPSDFAVGYPYPQRYHNIGQVVSPYRPKIGEGDYGPIQPSISYNYPYPVETGMNLGASRNIPKYVLNNPELLASRLWW